MNLHFLLERCINNDPKCQRLLYERYYGYAFKIVFRYIFKYEDVADVVNNGFVKLFKNIGTFASKGKAEIEPQFMGWLKKIMVHTAIDELRRSKKFPVLSSFTEDIWTDPQTADNPDDQLLYKELILLIKKLPPSYATLFNLHVIEGYSHMEISKLLGISEGTSKSGVFKAKAGLQKLISKQALATAC